MEKSAPMALDIEEGNIKAEAGREVKMPVLPKSLTLEEKKFLLSVERGDLASVKRIVHRAKRHQHVNLNCMDPLGRGALLMAIDNENLPMVELLVVMGIETKDALLHAIDKEFVEAVELLLEHEELIHKEGDNYSWEKVDRTTASFTPDITPLILAAHRNNYEILKILLDRGATLPMPHDVRCGCIECIRGVKEDSLRHSMSRINAYRALSSPSLIALSSTDPILTAFELSVELKNLAYAETEFRQQYMDLRRQCQQFACELLSHTRSSQELAILLNHDPTSVPYADGEHMKLARLELAIDYKQKTFVAHPNIQQLLGAIWYEGLPGFRRKSAVQKFVEVCQIALLFPIYCLMYILAPGSSTSQLMRKPFMKFLIHASSYLFFLLLLILVSQRFEVLIIQMFGTEAMNIALADQLKRQRGNGPTFLECVVALYVMGYFVDEMKEMWREGMSSYCRNMWNFIDLSRNFAYFLVMVLRAIAYFQQQKEIAINPATAYIPREDWDDYDPQLIAEGIFAMANIFSAIKLVHLFSINPYLGPLQISLGRMVIDIVKFFFIYSLVLFAFACGLNQLLWYFADLEKQKCYNTPDGLPDWRNSPESCLKWRRFANLFESSQSLFWASFGLVDLSNFELSGIKSYTRFWGLLMFGSYSVINVVVLLNLLIAMMSNSYSLITEHSDTEWKFARSKLWMSYFELGSTLPPPFNLFPTPKDILRWLGLRKKDKLRRLSSKRRQSHIRERDYRYAAVMRSLVWRYVIAMHRRQEMSEVTEDDVNEVKGDISTLRFELLEVFKNNGMDISCASKNTKTALGRKMRIWERRLLRDFHVVSMAGEEDLEDQGKSTTSLSDPAERFRRLAMLVVSQNAAKNQQTNAGSGSARNIKSLSHIGRSMSNESFKSSQNLRKAMEEAQRLTVMEPTPENSPRSSPLPILPGSGASALEILHNITEDEHDSEAEKSPTKNNKRYGTPKITPRSDGAPKPFFSKELITMRQEEHRVIQQKKSEQLEAKKREEQQQRSSSPRRIVAWPGSNTSAAATGEAKTMAQINKPQPEALTASKEPTPKPSPSAARETKAPSADEKRSKSPVRDIATPSSKATEDKSQSSVQVSNERDGVENSGKFGSPKRPVPLRPLTNASETGPKLPVERKSFQNDNANLGESTEAPVRKQSSEKATSEATKSLAKPVEDKKLQDKPSIAVIPATPATPADAPTGKTTTPPSFPVENINEKPFKPAESALVSTRSSTPPSAPVKASAPVPPAPAKPPTPPPTVTITPSTPAPGKTAPTKTPAPTPAPVKVADPAPATAKTPGPTSAPIKASEPAPAPAKTAEPAAVKAPAPVKAPEPTAATSKAFEPAAVKAPATEPIAVHAPISMKISPAPSVPVKDPTSSAIPTKIPTPPPAYSAPFKGPASSPAPPVAKAESAPVKASVPSPAPASSSVGESAPKIVALTSGSDAKAAPLPSTSTAPEVKSVSAPSVAAETKSVSAKPAEASDPKSPGMLSPTESTSSLLAPRKVPDVRTIRRDHGSGWM